MPIKKLKLYTNIEKTMGENDSHLEAVQRISLFDTGKVIFSSEYRVDSQMIKARREEIEIDTKVMQEIFEKVVEFFETQPHYNLLPTFGMFELTLVDEYNHFDNYFSSMTGVHSDISQFISRRIPIEDMYLFG